MLHPRTYAEQSNAPARLVADHMDLVRKIAWHYHARTGNRVDISDLMQAGYLGLVEASQRYRPQEGVTFAAYAALRIRGAIVDHLRSTANICRATIAMKQKVTKARNALTQRLQRDPTPAEMAGELDLSDADYTAWQSRIAAGSVQSLDEIYSDHSAFFRDDTPSAEEMLGSAELQLAIRRALTQVPEREALVLQLYYLEELNVFEIAKVLGVTTGRVSQIKKSAVEHLRAALGALVEL